MTIAGGRVSCKQAFCYRLLQAWAPRYKELHDINSIILPKMAISKLYRLSGYCQWRYTTRSRFFQWCLHAKNSSTVNLILFFFRSSTALLVSPSWYYSFLPQTQHITWRIVCFHHQPTGTRNIKQDKQVKEQENLHPCSKSVATWAQASL